MNILIALTISVAGWITIPSNDNVHIALHSESLEIRNFYTVAKVLHKIDKEEPFILYYAVTNNTCATAPDIIILDETGNVITVKMYNKNTVAGKIGDILCDSYEKYIKK